MVDPCNLEIVFMHLVDWTRSAAAINCAGIVIVAHRHHIKSRSEENKKKKESHWPMSNWRAAKKEREINENGLSDVRKSKYSNLQCISVDFFMIVSWNFRANGNFVFFYSDRCIICDKRMSKINNDDANGWSRSWKGWGKSSGFVRMRDDDKEPDVEWHIAR